ncbi:hypothetical protein MRX96_009817 [Rhipicephalus microplus]
MNATAGIRGMRIRFRRCTRKSNRVSRWKTPMASSFRHQAPEYLHAYEDEHNLVSIEDGQLFLAFGSSGEFTPREIFLKLLLALQVLSFSEKVLQNE